MNEFEKWLEANGFPKEEDLTDKAKEKLKATWEAETAKPPKNAPPKNDPPKDDPPKEIKGEEGDKDLVASRKREADEVRRVDRIRKLFSNYSKVEKVTVEGKEIEASEFKAKAIEEGIDEREVEVTLIRAERPEARGPAVHVVPDLEGPVIGEAIAASICRGQMKMKASFKGADGREYGYEKQFSEKALEASDDRRLRRVSLHQIMQFTVQAAEGLPYTGDLKSDDFIRQFLRANQKLRAASGPFSTLAVTDILENVANKSLLARFQMQNTVWQSIARISDLNDFKPHSRYRLQEDLGYLKVGADGTLKHGEVSDEKRTIQADTYGRLFALTRQHMRNDDLDAFRQILDGLADGSAWALESETAAQLLSQIGGGSFFTSENGNLISDDLDIPGLTVAEQKFLDQTRPNGAPILHSPSILLVGTQDSVLAAQLNTDLRVVSTSLAGGFESNPHVGKYRAITWPYLSNTSLKKPDGSSFSNQDSDQWLLMANPDSIPTVEVGLLDGRTIPFIEQAETSFDTLGIQWRGYHDFGVAEGDTEAAVLSLGDDSSV